MSKKTKHRRDQIKTKLRYHRHRAEKLGLVAEYVTAGQWKEKVLALGSRCVYCKKREPKDSRLTFDHLIPLVRGGSHTLNNLVPACLECNLKKGGNLVTEWKPKHAFSKAYKEAKVLIKRDLFHAINIDLKSNKIEWDYYEFLLKRQKAYG